MRTNFKLRLVLVCIVAIIATFFVGETLSYYSIANKATNVITSGNIQFIINEKTDKGEKFPEEGVYVVPGDIVSKKVSIQSDCEHPFYVRAKVVYGDDSDEISAENAFKLNINETDWILKDGWYYYTGIVNPGQSTSDIFSNVEVVGSNVDNSFLGANLKISVVAQAVQSENNSVENNETYNAAGWPKE